MERHRQEHTKPALWQSLCVGQELTVVKLSPAGEEAARYPASVVAHDSQDCWIALQAIWTYRRVDIDGLIFEPGDQLIEWFSPIQPFNAFAVLSPAGELRGWYANVTYPAYLEPGSTDEGSPMLVWHDLYLDLVGLREGTFVSRDEDELAESGLKSSAPILHAEIVAALEDLAQRFRSGRLPFCLPFSVGIAPVCPPAVPE